MIVTEEQMLADAIYLKSKYGYDQSDEGITIRQLVDFWERNNKTDKMEQPIWLADATPMQIVTSEAMVRDITEMISEGKYDDTDHWFFCQSISESLALLREHRHQLFNIHLERKKSLKVIQMEYELKQYANSTANVDDFKKSLTKHEKIIDK
jgi:hypothetical protein